MSRVGRRSSTSYSAAIGRCTGSSTRWRGLGEGGEEVREAIEIDINHRRREQRERLADKQPTDHGVPERLADFGTVAGAEHERHAAQ